MGASNALAAFRLYAGKVPPTPLNVLVYMALVSVDRDAEPSWWEGHEMIAIRALGYPAPPPGKRMGRAGIGAVERAIAHLHQAGAITTTRNASGHPKGTKTVRYRLWLTGPASHETSGTRRAPRPTKTMGGQAPRPTKSVSASHENHGTKEYEEELKQEREHTSTGLDLRDVEGADRARELDERLDRIIARLGPPRPRATS